MRSNEINPLERIVGIGSIVAEPCLAALCKEQNLILEADERIEQFFRLAFGYAIFFAFARRALGQFSSACIQDLGVFRTDLLETRCAAHFGFSLADFFAGVKQLLHLFRPIVSVRLPDVFHIRKQMSATKTVVAVVVFELRRPAVVHYNRPLARLVLIRIAAVAMIMFRSLALGAKTLCPGNSATMACHSPAVALDPKYASPIYGWRECYGERTMRIP